MVGGCRLQVPGVRCAAGRLALRPSPPWIEWPRRVTDFAAPQQRTLQPLSSPKGETRDILGTMTT
eukprot:7391439-Prymnesium_polylepis.1